MYLLDARHPRFDQPSCPLTSCGASSGRRVRLVLVIRVVAPQARSDDLGEYPLVVRFSPECLSVQASVVTVPCANTRSPFVNDSTMFSPRVLNARATCRVGSTSPTRHRCSAGVR